MVALVEMRFDEARLRGYERMLRGVRGGLPRAMIRAINRTAKQMRSGITKKLTPVARQHLGRSVAQKEVRKSISVRSARRSRLAGRVRVRGGKQIELVGKPFKATMPSGHEGTYRRARDWRHRVPKNTPAGDRRKHGLPIHEIGKDGDSFPIQAVPDDDLDRVIAEETREAGEDLQRNLDKQVRALIAREAAKRR